MRNLGRATAIALVLGLQAWAISPFAGSASERAWPFVRYAMYSHAHAYGEHAGAARLAASPCAGGTAVPLGPESVGAASHKHCEGLLRQAGARTDARSRLAAYADRVAPGRWCAFEIVHDSAVVMRDGPVPLAPGPVVIARWGRE